MGLSNHLSDSIPILLVATAAGWVSYLRSLLLTLFLHPFFFFSSSYSSRISHQLLSTTTSPDETHVGSHLFDLILLAEQLNSHHHRAFFYGEEEDETGEEEKKETGEECVVCLEMLRDGEKVRRLPCCRRVFHTKCLHVWWFDQNRLTCPLCRSPLLSDDEDHRHNATAAAGRRRVGDELVAWFAPYYC